MQLNQDDNDELRKRDDGDVRLYCVVPPTSGRSEFSIMTFENNNAPHLRLAAPRLLLTCSSSSACLRAEAQDGARPWLSSPFFFFCGPCLSWRLTWPGEASAAFWPAVSPVANTGPPWWQRPWQLRWWELWALMYCECSQHAAKSR